MLERREDIMCNTNKNIDEEQTEEEILLEIIENLESKQM